MKGRFLDIHISLNQFRIFVIRISFQVEKKCVNGIKGVFYTYTRLLNDLEVLSVMLGELLDEDDIINQLASRDALHTLLFFNSSYMVIRNTFTCTSCVAYIEHIEYFEYRIIVVYAILVLLTFFSSVLLPCIVCLLYYKNYSTTY